MGNLTSQDQELIRQINKYLSSKAKWWKFGFSGYYILYAVVHFKDIGFTGSAPIVFLSIVIIFIFISIDKYMVKLVSMIEKLYGKPGQTTFKSD